MALDDSLMSLALAMHRSFNSLGLRHVILCHIWVVLAYGVRYRVNIE